MRTQIAALFFSLFTIIFNASLAPAPVHSLNQKSAPAAGAANQMTLDFERMNDKAAVTTQFANIGVSFVGSTILSQGKSLNYLLFPPHSGVNVLYDDPIYSGLITVYFNQNIVHNVFQIGAYVTGNRNITLTAYDVNGNAVGSTATGGPNYAPNGPNKLLQISSNTAIAKATFFNGGERGNTFTVDDFSFQSEQSCQINTVPLYKQSDSQWGGDAYGGSTANPWTINGKTQTISTWGCALTSSAMIVSYYGLQQNGATTNPRELNNWLKANKGYSEGAILWGKVAEFARDVKHINLYYYSGWGPGDGIVNQAVCNSYPIILNTNSSPYTGGHYVVAQGMAGTNAWSINDPGGYNLAQLNAKSYIGYRKYGPTLKEPKELSIVIHSPVEILVTDPAGRKTGYDPKTGKYVNTILDASYQDDVLGARDGSNRSVRARVFDTGFPINGQYTLDLIGTGNGNYHIDFIAYDSAGQSSTTSIQGHITSGRRIYAALNYSDAPGSQIHVNVGATVYVPMARNRASEAPPPITTPTPTAISTQTATPSFTPTPTATSTSTPTPTRTATPTPSATPLAGAPTLDNLLIRNEAWQDQTVFLPGDTIRLGMNGHVPATYTTTVGLWWLVTDDAGNRIPELSFDDFQTVVGPGFWGYDLTRTIPTSLSPGQYTFRGELHDNGHVQFLTSTFVITSPVGGQALLNGGFEEDANGDGKPDSWSLNQKFTRSASATHSGSFAGALASTSSTYRVWQWVPSMVAGTTYTFGGSVVIPSD
jgi:hypothetical protein